MTVPRILLIGALLLTLGVDAVVRAWEARDLEHQIYRLQQEREHAQARCERQRSSFQAHVVAARTTRGQAPTAPATELIAHSPESANEVPMGWRIAQEN